MSLMDTNPELRDEAFVSAFDFADCWTTTNHDGAFNVVDVAVALIRAEGVIKTAAAFLGRSRRSVETFVLRTLELRELQEDIEEAFLDDIEIAYRLDARNGDTAARKFFLMTKGRNRGYIVKNETVGKHLVGNDPDNPLPSQVVIFQLPDNGRGVESKESTTE